MSVPAYEIHPYSIQTLKEILVLKSEKNPPEVIESKNHTAFFEGYFNEPSISAKTIIVENDYVDRDFLDDYSGYYVRCFKRYRRKCTRLHFFDTLITEEEFNWMLQGKAEDAQLKSFKKSYLGFVVIKRLPETIVGRTCLKTYGDDNGRRHYNTIRCYGASLFGLELAVETLAFQEQDHVVAACATSALWSCFQGTGKMFQHPFFSPVEITKAACDHMPLETRAFPNRGLSAEQIAHAIQSVNLEPYAVEVTNREILQANVYAYCKMGLPLLLGTCLVDTSGDTPKHLDDHLVTVTGYSLPPVDPIPHELSGFLTMSAQIDKIYAHDDQVGPFSRMTLDPDEITFVHRDLGKIKGNAISTSYDVTAMPKTIFIPLYNKIRIPLEPIRDIVIDFDEHIEAFRDLDLLSLPQRLVWDIYLMTINQFKKSVLESDWSGGKDKRELLLKQMPRFLWRATAFCDKMPVMDLLFDATDIEHGFFLTEANFFNSELEELIEGIHSLPAMVEDLKLTDSWRIIGALGKGRRREMETAAKKKIVAKLRSKVLSASGKTRLAEARKRANATKKAIKKASRVDPSSFKQIFTI